MSQSFSTVTSPCTNGHTLATDLTPYHPALAKFSSFPGLNSFVQSQMSLPTPTQQVFPHPQPPQPPSSGNSDVEKLERLKKEILEGQNPIYKAVPQPSFLESLYLGRSVQAQNSAPAHPDQIATGSPPSSITQTQTSSTVSPNDAAEEKNSEHQTTGNDTGQSLDEKSKIGQNINTKMNPSRPEDSTHARSSSAEMKSSQTDHHSYSSGATGRGALELSSTRPADTASHGDHTTGQTATFPGSESVTTQASVDSFQSSRGPLSDPVLSVDPPYDPRESLRHLENSAIWLNDRHSHASGPYNSIAPDPRYVRALDDIPNREQDRAREWESRYDYRYDERRYVADSFRDRYPNATPNADFKGPDERYSPEDRTDPDLHRLASSLSNSVFRPPDSHATSNSQSGGPAMHPNIGTSAIKSANGVDQMPFSPSLTVTPSMASQYAADVYLTRTPAVSNYAQPAEVKSPPEDRSSLPQSHNRSRQASINQGLGLPIQIVEGKVPLEERIGDRTPSSAAGRNGIRVPLEERITSPPIDRLSQSVPAMQEGSGDRPSLEERITSPMDALSPTARESVRPGSMKSIPTPLSLVRPRPIDEKVTTSSPVSASTLAQVSHPKIEEYTSRTPSSDNVQRNELLQPRFSPQRSEPYPPVQGNPLDAHSAIRPPSNDASDEMLIPSAAYRGDRGRPFADVGHHDRPILLERDAVATEDRSRPSLESREWRERSAYSRAFVPRSDAHPSSGSSPRVWTANAQITRPPEPSFDDRDRYYDREYDRRTTLPPRSWDREDVSRARPPPEIYPPPDDIVRDRYPPAELRERPRIRGRSPSPNPMRRSTYGGPPMADLRPAKRVRDETYYDERERRYSDYHARQVSSPPSATSGYYVPRPPYVSRDVHDAYSDRGHPSDDIAYYDRRSSDMGPPSSPPYTGRGIYSRPDLDRYNGMPPRTA